MAHTTRNKKKLLDRVSRIRGQLNGIESAIQEDRDCGNVLLTLASCRGAMNSLMAEILRRAPAPSLLSTMPVGILMRHRPQKNLSTSSKGTSSNETMPTSPMTANTGPTGVSLHNPETERHDHGAGSVEYARLALMALVVVASMTGWWKPWMTRDWLAFAATLFGGLPIFSEALENLRKRRMTMELSMTIALLGALSIGQFFTALVIAFFVLFAEMLEGLTVGGGRKAIRQLIDSLPRSVTVRRGGEERELGTHEISRGETIVIRAGERIPCDGVVIKGSSFVDQASITGESMPSEKLEGSTVFAGTINKNGIMEVTVERIGRDTTFGKIVEVIEEAEKSKAPVQRVADKLAAALVYFAFGAALLTFVVTRNVVSTIAVIIVAGACGVAAGTPLAILAGIGSAARRGIIIKGGLYLEQLSQIDTVVLDKTGTLTLGIPKVTGIIAANGASEQTILQFAAIAEQHSEHPLGEAIVRSAKEHGVSPRPYSAIRTYRAKVSSARRNRTELSSAHQRFSSNRGVGGTLSGDNGDTPGQTSVLVACNGALPW